MESPILEEEHYTSSFLTKGRRTKRQRSSTTTATLTSTAGDRGGGSGCSGSSSDCGISQSDFDHDTMSGVMITSEEQDMANCLILLAQGIQKSINNNNKITSTTTTTSNINCVYECKTCNRAFPSFQALGGHRASHKKPKPITTTTTTPSPSPSPSPSPPSHHMEDHRDLATDDQEESTTANTNIMVISTTAVRNINNNSSNKGRIHECSICGSEFPSGQALGGHMRRHRAPAAAPAPALAPPEKGPISIAGGGARNHVLSLDLNLPAPDDDVDVETKFHVLPTPALVDCHY